MATETKESKGSFWTSLPGVLTGIAGILAAGGTVVGLINSHSGPTHPPGHGKTWGDQANAICAVAIQNGSGFVPSDPFNSQLNAAAQAAANWQSVDDQLRKLPASSQTQGAVSSMIGDWDQAITAMRAAIQAAQYNLTSDEQQDITNLNDLTAEGNSIANELGAGTCASGEF